MDWEYPIHVGFHAKMDMVSYYVHSVEEARLLPYIQIFIRKFQRK